MNYSGSEQHWQVEICQIDSKPLLKTNMAALFFPLSACYFVPWCQRRSFGLDLLTHCFSAVVHKSIGRRSYDLTTLLPPSSRYCLSVIWQTKRLLIQSRNKMQHPPFTLRLWNTPTGAANFSKTRLSHFFYSISKGRELLTPDQREYHSKHGRYPNRDTHPVCECVICEPRLWKSPLWPCECA